MERPSLPDEIVVERPDDEVDEILSIGQTTFEKPHHYHVMGKSHRVRVEPVEHQKIIFR